MHRRNSQGPRSPFVLTAKQARGGRSDKPHQSGVAGNPNGVTLKKIHLISPEISAAAGVSKAHPKGKCNLAIFPSAKKSVRTPLLPVPDPITGLVPLLTIKQVASYLNQSTRTVHRLVARRKIDCFKLDGDLRFRLSDVERFLEKRLLRAA